jgi:hypothetical protein
VSCTRSSWRPSRATNIGFAIGHLGGRRLAERYGRYVLLTAERLDKATAFFAATAARSSSSHGSSKG